MTSITDNLPKQFDYDPLGMVITVKKAGMYSYDAQGAGWTYRDAEPLEGRCSRNYFEIDPLTLVFRVERPGKYEYDAQSGHWILKERKE